LSPRSGQRDPYYCPERDIAHNGPFLIRSALMALDEQFHEPWFKQYLSEHNVTLEQLWEAARLMCRTLRYVLQEHDIGSALELSGFAALPAQLQVSIYTRLGQMLLAAIFSGIKDVNRPDSDPPLSIEELCCACEEIDVEVFVKPVTRE